MKPCTICGKPTHEKYGTAAKTIACCYDCYQKAEPGTAQRLEESLKR